MSFDAAAGGALSGAAAGTAIMPGVGSVIGAGLGLVGGLLNSNSQAEQNQKNRDFSMQMYQRQYNDSVNFWNMQNEYNSPSAQMARLKAAGLNPNMVYGNGTAAGNTSGSPALPSQASYHGEATNPGQAITGALGQLGTYYDLQAKQATVDNMQQQNKLLSAQIFKTISETSGQDLSNKFADQSFQGRLQDAVSRGWLTTAQSNLAEQQYGFNKDINPLQIDAARLANRNTQWVIRNNALQPSLTRQQIQSVALRNLMDTFETNLNKLGLTKQDPEWQRILGLIINSSR